MALRNARPLSIKPVGLSDARDGTNAFPGAMANLSNLTFAQDTKGLLVCRPAAVATIDFAAGGFNTPTRVTAVLVLGNRVYGFVSTSRFAGKDEPFIYDLVTAAFITVAGVTSANCPSTLPTTGEWQPPKLAAITSSYIIATHAGFPGGGVNFGWFDQSSFTSTSLTITTVSGNPTITPSSNPIVAGWQPGMTIVSANLPANTRIVSVTTTTVLLSANASVGAAGTAATVAGGTSGAPLWGAGNTSGFGLVGVPWSVAQFNGRAYFGVGNSLAFSDALQPLLRTNATQALTLGDDQPITAVQGMPLNKQVTGGVLQSLTVFKGVSDVFQITGDQATTNLTQDAITGAVGTLAPNSIASTPMGLLYASPDGLRLITLDGTCSDVIGADGDGVSVPIISAINPSRMCADFNQDTYRISVQNGAAFNQPWQEYWLSLKRRAWTGPHTCPHTVIAAYAGNPTGFIGALQGVNAKLWTSSVIPRSTSSYTENGMALSWQYQLTLLPDNGAMAENAMIESTVAIAAGSTTVNVQATNEGGSLLDSASLVFAGSAGGQSWGGFNWGDGTLWGPSVAAALRQYRIPWTKPLVFKQMQISLSGPSLGNFAIGNIYLRYQQLGYMIDPNGGVAA